HNTDHDLGASLVTSGVFQTINPATGEVLAEHPAIADGDVDTIVQKSREAFSSWRSLSIEERAAKVEKLASLLEENADELASIMTKDMGKPLTEAKEETEFSAEIFRYYAT